MQSSLDMCIPACILSTVCMAEIHASCVGLTCHARHIQYHNSICEQTGHSNNSTSQKDIQWYTNLHCILHFSFTVAISGVMRLIQVASYNAVEFASDNCSKPVPTQRTKQCQQSISKN